VLIFQVKLDKPSPEGVKISKKNICFVEIVPDDKAMDQEDEIQQKMLEYLLQQKDATWA